MTIQIAGIPASKVLQIVETETSAVATGTTTLPADDTTPQSTEGDQYLTQAITPKSALSKILILTCCMLSTTNAGDFTVAVFRDAIANALKAIGSYITGPTPFPLAIVLIAQENSPGAGASVTYKVRAGNAAAATTTLNGGGGTRRYGGVAASSLVLVEYLP
jgi:hypothetical protein